jgi:predicted N-acyltransferase
MSVATESPWTLRTIDRIDAVNPTAWDRLAEGAAPARNPFLSHRFLLALERSGSATRDAGWQPFHLLLEDEAGTLRGAVPNYLKSHSQGEYIFDYAWAEAYGRAGGQYYPKALSAIPFTPATGPRLLVPSADPDAGALRGALAAGAKRVTAELGLSSFHVNFATETDGAALREAGFLERHDQQFHFTNAGFADFEAFLDTLSSKRRKTVRRERRDALANGISVRWVTGDALTEGDFEAFYAFYQDTGSRKWGQPYLTRAFFSELLAELRDDTLLIMADRDGMPIAGALNFIGGDTLFGRNWGCLEDHPFLHFEVCYYQAIDFALAHGLKRVEAGAQGGHKLARGYLPQRTRSFHWIAHEGFRDAVDRYLKEERRYVADELRLGDAHSPFKATLDLATLRGEQTP